MTKNKDIIPVEERFWKFVDKKGANDCWEWLGAKTQAGYGQINDGGVAVFAHRLAWMLKNGPIPDGLWVLHSCDNPGCVNETHLHLGTNQDNSREMRERGRAVYPPLTPKGIFRGFRVSHKGELNPLAKLSNKDVDNIRIDLSRGVHPQIIAQRFNVSKATIYDIRSGRTRNG